MQTAPPLAENEQVFVSITGLRVKSWLFYPQFFWLAGAAMNQARQAPGLIDADTRTINGVHHTLSVWENETAMRAYLSAGAHLQAMRAFRSIASGKTVGFTTAHPPDWSEVHDIWVREGREAGS